MIVICDRTNPIILHHFWRYLHKLPNGNLSLGRSLITDLISALQSALANCTPSVGLFRVQFVRVQLASVNIY